VNEKLREKIIAAVEKSIKIAGAKDYQSGMEQARKLLAFLYEGVESMKTPDDLRTLLDGCPPMSRREEMVYLLLAQNMHHVLRLGLRAAAKKAASDLPGGGRPPALSKKEAREALDYLAKLNRMGCPFAVSKTRTAQKYGCTVRTIERLWSQRASFSDDAKEPEVSLEEAVYYFVNPQES
jgi:hypothetical protein